MRTDPESKTGPCDCGREGIKKRGESYFICTRCRKLNTERHNLDATKPATPEAEVVKWKNEHKLLNAALDRLDIKRGKFNQP